MKFNWLPFKILLLLLAMIALVIVSNIKNQSRLLGINQIHINHDQGNYFVNDSVVFLTFDSGVKPLSKTKVKDIEINKLESWLVQNPYIDKANVYFDLNGAVNASIQQKIPIARVINGQDEFYLTKRAERVPLSSLHAAKVILVQGNVLPNEFEPLVDLIQQINEDKLWKKHIIGIQKQSANSFNLIVRQASHTIELGNLKQTDKKLMKLRAFYKQQLPKVDNNYYKTINLSFKNQVVATRKNKL